MSRRPRAQIGDKYGMLTIESVRRVGTGDSVYLLWLCRCKCNGTREVRTADFYAVRRTPLSCGCMQKNKPKKPRPPSGRYRDPTPEEIAEECLVIHQEAGREPPLKLLEKLGFTGN